MPFDTTYAYLVLLQVGFTSRPCRHVRGGLLHHLFALT